MKRHFLRVLIAGIASMSTGCWEIIIPADDVEVVPSTEIYGTCFSDYECVPEAVCEELAVPADAYGDFVNAVCTVGCFDDLDCPVSVFNLLPGACIPSYLVGGYDATGICIERCEIQADCDQYAGFACKILYGEPVCLPDR